MCTLCTVLTDAVKNSRKKNISFPLILESANFNVSKIANIYVFNIWTRFCRLLRKSPASVEGTVVNQAFQYLHGSLLKITLKVPLNVLHDLQQVPPISAAVHCTVYTVHIWTIKRINLISLSVQKQIVFPWINPSISWLKNDLVWTLSKVAPPKILDSEYNKLNHTYSQGREGVYGRFYNVMLEKPT